MASDPSPAPPKPSERCGCGRYKLIEVPRDHACSFETMPPLPKPSEELPACPICGCAPPTYESAPGEWVTRCHGEYHRLTVLGDSQKEAKANWRRLAAPALHPTVVEVLRAAVAYGVAQEAPLFGDALDGLEEAGIAYEKAFSAWTEAGRPGLPGLPKEGSTR